MSVTTATAKDPVQVYYDAIGKCHATIRRHTPFTYLAYNSLLPTEKEGDYIGLAYKISYYIVFRFFIRLGERTISPFFGVIPLIPFVADFCWVGYHGIKERWIERKEGASPFTALFFLTVSGAALHLLKHVPDY